MKKWGKTKNNSLRQKEALNNCVFAKTKKVVFSRKKKVEPMSFVALIYIMYRQYFALTFGVLSARNKSWRMYVLFAHVFRENYTSTGQVTSLYLR